MARGCITTGVMSQTGNADVILQNPALLSCPRGHVELPGDGRGWRGREPGEGQGAWGRAGGQGGWAAMRAPRREAGEAVGPCVAQRTD